MCAFGGACRRPYHLVSSSSHITCLHRLCDRGSRDHAHADPRSHAHDRPLPLALFHFLVLTMSGRMGPVRVCIRDFPVLFDCHVYCGRGDKARATRRSEWANPFLVSVCASRSACVQRFRDYLHASPCRLYEKRWSAIAACIRNVTLPRLWTLATARTMWTLSYVSTT